MRNDTRPAYKILESAAAMKRFMAEHFYELEAAGRDGRRKIAWCTSVGPAELLRAMGFLIFFPENHAALLGATRKATEYIPTANREGYSPDICSYLTSDIGAFLRGQTPLAAAYEGITQVPKPDVLVFNTNQCRDVKDWFLWYSRRLGIPCFGVESFHNVDAVTADHLQAITSQLQQLVPKLEPIAGAKFKLDRLREVVDLSRQCSILWGEVLATAAARPSPFTFFDGVIHMGPAVIGRGTPGAIAYYEQLLGELRERITTGVAAVDGERYRIYWEGMPIWGKLRELSAFFSELRASVVASTYCNSWVFSALDPDRPFESMARAYTELFIVRSDHVKERYIEQMIRSYGVDGILFHNAKTCPNNSNSRYGMPGRLATRCSVPTVVIDGDLNDLRLFSEEQSMTRIEAFIEQLRP